MTDTDRSDYRQKLLTLGRRLKTNIAGLAREALRQAGGEASGGLSNAPMHLADLGTDTYEQEVALSLLDTGSQRLGDVNGALQRLDDGTFGRCVACDSPIGRERLDALPYVRHCINCARRLDAVGG